jgi:hypothetical protein
LICVMVINLRVPMGSRHRGWYTFDACYCDQLAGSVTLGSMHRGWHAFLS